MFPAAAADSMGPFAACLHPPAKHNPMSSCRLHVNWIFSPQPDLHAFRGRVAYRVQLRQRALAQHQGELGQLLQRVLQDEAPGQGPGCTLLAKGSWAGEQQQQEPNMEGCPQKQQFRRCFLCKFRVCSGQLQRLCMCRQHDVCRHFSRSWMHTAS